ncbi:MAG: hypothetical protein AABY14_02855, partial [Nanoarchaeota archaeon]
MLFFWDSLTVLINERYNNKEGHFEDNRTHVPIFPTERSNEKIDLLHNFNLYFQIDSNSLWRSTVSTMMSKQEAKRLVDMMPDNATWDDLIHEIYVREAIERGL